MFVSWIIYAAHMIAALQALALAQNLKAVWHLHGIEVSVKRRFLYKHLRDAFFPSPLFLRPCQIVEKGNIVWKEYLAL